MLTRQHLRKHHSFLHQVYTARTIRQVRRDLARAKHHQLRTVLLTLAAVALRQLPAPEKVSQAFFHSRKKRLLRQVLGSRAKFRRFLRDTSADEWRRVLTELAPLLRPALSVVFES